MKIRLVFAVLIGVFAMTCHQQAPAQKHQDSAPQDAPASITVNNYDHSQHEYQNKPDVARWWPEGITAIAVILNLLAIAYQARQSRRAVDAALESVRTTEKNMILQFRPKVIIRGGHVIDADRLEEATMEFAITNIGASAATVLETELVAKLVNYPSPTFSLFEQSFPISLLKLEPGMGHLHTFTLDKETTAAIQQMDFDHRNKSDNGKKTILFAGTLRYRDELGILRRTGIFRGYSAAQRRFVSLSDPDYEYAD